MAERFSIDPEGLRRLSRELDSIRSAAAAARHPYDATGIGPAMVAEALQAFGSTAARSHEDLHRALEQLARWLDAAADGQLSLDQMLSPHNSEPEGGRST